MEDFLNLILSNLGLQDIVESLVEPPTPEKPPLLQFSHPWQKHLFVFSSIVVLGGLAVGLVKYTYSDSKPPTDDEVQTFIEIMNQFFDQKGNPK